MTAVMIGVDPHKGSHTAVVIGSAEELLGEVRVRASAGQAEKLVAWAADWPERIWAVEGAAGLGRLLAQQLVAAGERVLDVQPKLASRVRCCRLATRTRTTRTTRGPWRSRRCGPGPAARWPPRTTRRS
jgi:Transposase